MSTVASQDYPSLNPYGTVANGTAVDSTPAANSRAANGTSAAGLKDSILGSEATADAIANHPTTQSIANGKLISSYSPPPGTDKSPMAQTAKTEVAKTSDQFSNVAASRKTPDNLTATGQNLTHYHSLFFNILSWENPRVTGIAYAAIVAFIFTTRYVPILKYFFKFTYIVLGVIAAAEIAGKLIFDKGLATQMRPRKYYTIPRESLEAALEDAEQFINFFIIEFQRIVFAENVYATVAAFTAALIAYFLVKFVPKWGLALIGTTTIFFLPLVYIQNRELIDSQINNASTIINEQAVQVRDLAAQHTGRAGEVAKSTVSQYSAKAQELIGHAKSKTTGATSPESTPLTQKEEFPAAPKAPTASSKATTSDPFKADFPVAPQTAPMSFEPPTSAPLREDFPTASKIAPSSFEPTASVPTFQPVPAE